MKPFAVALAGSGRADGSEIHESVSVLVHLSRHGATYACFAPDQPQADVIDHASGKAMHESRNCLVEAARISRGDIRDLASLRASEYSGVIFPGGFGAAKNLCTFATDGAKCKVQQDAARVLREFHEAGKPIGLICIAPVMAAAVFGKVARGAERGGCSITLGTDSGNDAANAARAMGATHVGKAVTDALLDEPNRLVTTPAYMCDATPFEVFTGIGKLVDEVLRLAK
jgi:enhancing lycopene biosynthesis protein 2